MQVGFNAVTPKSQGATKNAFSEECFPSRRPAMYKRIDRTPVRLGIFASLRWNTLCSWNKSSCGAHLGSDGRRSTPQPKSFEVDPCCPTVGESPSRQNGLLPAHLVLLIEHFTEIDHVQTLSQIEVKK